MVTPPNRRLGFNRKAQYRAFTGYVLAILGGFVGLFLLVISFIDPTGFAALRGAASEATAPVSGGLAGARAGASNSWDEVSAYFAAASKNADLERTIERQEAQIVEANALRQENIKLRRLLGLVEQEADTTVTISRLINSTATSTSRIATIYAGSRQGVEAGQPVRSSKGLVGRVLTTTPNTAKILLLTDPRNRVPVKRTEDGIVGFTEGLGDGRIAIKLVEMGVNPFEPGDIMVTSGNGGLYRPNIPVAVVVESTADGAIANLLSTPAATDYVTVQPRFIPIDDPSDNSDGQSDDSIVDGAAQTDPGR
ncbi:rod shape-determining protein MreC [Parasphingorhabdus sp. DH2-15]|uniref:rod shape-determining protein MreC n=1 Tax=Parasphingorhabdus sp. DH2-15 TaxID=3444112 RepID=UPI003F6873BF